MAELKEISFREPAAKVAAAADDVSGPGEDLRDIEGDKLVLNMGPSHPSTHGEIGRAHV